MNYIKIKDEFDNVELKIIGDEWCVSWSWYRKIFCKLLLSHYEKILADELKKLSLIDLRIIHNCMTCDNALKIRYDIDLQPKRHYPSIMVFNAVVDMLIENEKKIR